MNIEEVRDFYLSLPKSYECFPFDDTTLVMKVGSKMFGYLPLERDEPYLVLKCEPERAIFLREHYSAITPAWHMNKRHWNGLHYNGLDPQLVRELIKHSYDLVVGKMSKKERNELGL